MSEFPGIVRDSGLDEDVTEFAADEEEDDGSALGPEEFLLRYRVRDGRVRLGAEAFFFQEGHAERYEAAKYGEVRVASSGSSVLVGLRDAKREVLGSALAPRE